METWLKKKRRTPQESSFSKITPSQMRGIFLYRQHPKGRFFYTQKEESKSQQNKDN